MRLVEQILAALLLASSAAAADAPRKPGILFSEDTHTFVALAPEALLVTAGMGGAGGVGGHAGRGGDAVFRSVDAGDWRTSGKVNIIRVEGTIRLGIPGAEAISIDPVGVVRQGQRFLGNEPCLRERFEHYIKTMRIAGASYDYDSRPWVAGDATFTSGRGGKELSGDEAAPGDIRFVDGNEVDLIITRETIATIDPVPALLRWLVKVTSSFSSAACGPPATPRPQRGGDVVVLR